LIQYPIKVKGFWRSSPYPADLRLIRCGKPGNCGSGERPDVDGPADQFDRSAFSNPAPPREKRTGNVIAPWDTTGADPGLAWRFKEFY
jgi:hypothetical protein